MGKMDKKVGGIKAPEAAQTSPTQTSEERRWRAEEDLRTITRAHEIHSDKGRIGEVTKLAKQQMATLAKVADHGQDSKKGQPKAMVKGNQGGKRK